MFQHILVPLDGSARAERAIPVAARIARATGGSVVLLQVVNFPGIYWPYIYESYLSQSPIFAQQILDAELAKARYYLTIFAQSEHLTGIETKTEVLSGEVAASILTTAQRQRVDLIVLCSHGRTGFKRWALGSVAEKVARYSPTPVLLLREEGPEAGDLSPDATHVLRALVALDGSPFAEGALAPAAHLVAALAAPAQGALHLTQVVSLPTIHSERECTERRANVREQVMREAATYLSSLADKMRNELAGFGLKVTCSVPVNADVADALIRMAELGEDLGTYELRRCDLIAMATHGRSGLQSWTMGSITERVLVGTKLPLLIMRPQEQHISTISKSREGVVARS